MRTPWGPSQYVTEHGEGITFVSTASHGGFRVMGYLLPLMPKPLRHMGEGGVGCRWYEEDCEWPAVVLSFPDRFEVDKTGPDNRETALSNLLNWHPEQYEEFTGKDVPKGTSIMRTPVALRGVE